MGNPAVPRCEWTFPRDKYFRSTTHGKTAAGVGIVEASVPVSLVIVLIMGALENRFRAYPEEGLLLVRLGPRCGNREFRSTS